MEYFMTFFILNKNDWQKYQRAIGLLFLGPLINNNNNNFIVTATKKQKLKKNKKRHQ